MSFFLEILLSPSVEESLQQFSSGQVGALTLGDIAPWKPGMWRAEWPYGHIVFDQLNEESKAVFQEVFGLPYSLQSRLWITTEPYYEGQLAAYSLAAHLLRTQPGDLAFILNGDHLRIQRINGQLKLRVDCFNEDILPLFAGLEYEPLPVPPQS